MKNVLTGWDMVSNAYIVTVSCIGGGNRSTMRKPLTNFIT